MEHGAPTTWLLRLPFLPTEETHIHINGAILTFVLILVLSIIANRAIANKMEKKIIPERKFSVFTFFDVIIEGLYDLVIGILGHHGEKQFPMIAAIFVFILFSNLLGLLPLSESPSSNINTTFALGLVAFIYYNYQGIRSHGLVGYGKHFLMGLGILGVPIAAFEILSHVIRPGTLGIRLMLNLFIDHKLVGSFASMGKWLLPVPLLLFGIIVCTIQAFLFAVLTTVYVQMATEHEEEH